MSAKTLTELIDALDYQLDQVVRLDGLEAAFRAIRAAAPRYEAAMRLADAWEVRRVAEHLWWAASDGDGPTDSRLVNACNRACRDFDRAATAYREARS